MTITETDASTMTFKLRRSVQLDRDDVFTEGGRAMRLATRWDPDAAAFLAWVGPNVTGLDPEGDRRERPVIDQLHAGRAALNNLTGAWDNKPNDVQVHNLAYAVWWLETLVRWYTDQTMLSVTPQNDMDRRMIETLMEAWTEAIAECTDAAGVVGAILAAADGSDTLVVEVPG